MVLLPVSGFSSTMESYTQALASVFRTMDRATASFNVKADVKYVTLTCLVLLVRPLTNLVPAGEDTCSTTSAPHVKAEHNR